LGKNLKTMVSASLVLYHNKNKDVENVISSVLKSPIDILCIVDHSANDDFKSLSDKSDRIIYLHTENDGYGKGHNTGIKEILKQTKSDYHIVLNPDIYFESDAIKQLIGFMDNNPDVGLVMPKVYYPDGRFQYLCKLLPTPADIFLRQFAPTSIKERNNERYTLKNVDYNKTMDIPSLSGCFMFFRTYTFEKIGGFDERYFMHFEDIDITRRIGDISRTVYFPNATIIHAHEAAHKTSKKMLLVGLKSAVKYFNKWGWFFDKERAKRNKKALKYLRTNANE